MVLTVGLVYQPFINLLLLRACIQELLFLDVEGMVYDVGRDFKKIIIKISLEEGQHVVFVETYQMHIIIVNSIFLRVDRSINETYKPKAFFQYNYFTKRMCLFTIYIFMFTASL
jgi:hypothetical protein